MKSKRALIAALVIAFGISTMPVAVVSAAEEIPNCEHNVSLVNYRSNLLNFYKKREERDYRKVRQLWETRISYAGQWVEKDAKKARDALYEYDALHAATIKEVNKQIKSYKPLLDKPLDCASTDKKILKAKIKELNGWQGEKAVSGNALVVASEKKEDAYRKVEFKKMTDTMISKLHKEKRKNPQPLNIKLDVKKI